MALWREALLAQRVLEGRTRGYRHHPQLDRFRACRDPVAAIGSYLRPILAEAVDRGYAFNASLIVSSRRLAAMEATDGQLRFEARHLRSKLAIRSPRLVGRVPARRADPHPLFRVVTGPRASWER